MNAIGLLKAAEGIVLIKTMLKHFEVPKSSGILRRIVLMLILKEDQINNKAEETT